MAKETKQNKPKRCYYCINREATIDYKDVQTLRRFVSSSFLMNGISVGLLVVQVEICPHLHVL